MPTLSASFNVNSAGVDTSTLTSPSFTPAVGDVIVVKGVTWDVPPGINAPTDTQGNTYTRRAHMATANHVSSSIWATTAGTGASMTVSAGVTDACEHSITVERWTAAALDTTPASAADVGSGSPSLTITTTQPFSAVTWCNGDGAGGHLGQDPTGRTYNTTSATPVEDGIHDGSAYVAYFVWQLAASAGSQTFGITAPTGQNWSLAAMEVLDIPVGTDADQTSFGTLAWQ
jgi:hypothetical protein